MNNSEFQYSNNEYLPQKPEKQFSLVETVLALIVFVIGYLISSLIIFASNGAGLGAFVILFIMAVLSLVYLKIKKTEIAKFEYFRLAVILILALPLLLSSNGFINFLVLSYAGISFVYWFFCASGNREEKKIDGMLFFDLIKSALILPFSCFIDIFLAIGKSVKKTSSGKKVLMACLGVLIAIVPCAVVTVLLLNADDAFVNLTERIFSKFYLIPENIFYFLFGVPIAMYIFGMMYANATHEKTELMTREKNERAAKVLRFLPVILTCSAIIPVLLVYVLFFFSQTSYFLSAFSGIRPENITYAEYARKGFFELSAVSVINMIIIIAATVFTKRVDGKRHRAVKTCVIMLSVFTVALIAIAMSKMFMYIDAYGLSLLRIYTTWFMALLAFTFVFVIIKQISERFNFMRVLSVTFALMFAILVFSDADALTAKYNVERYKSGDLDGVDIGMMYELSDSAVKYVIPLAADGNHNIAEEAKRYLESKKLEYEYRDNGFANFNFSTYGAQKAVEDYFKSAK